MMRCRTAWVVFVMLAFFAPPAYPQTEPSADELQSMRRELEALRKSQEAMQKDLAEIKALLRARAASPPRPSPADMKVGLQGEPVRGAKSARVVLVEYSDYQCPYCQRVANETMPQIAAQYIDSGRIRHVFKDLPLESIHPNAFRAAVAAACAAEQGKYWELHHKLFENGKQLGAAQLPQYAEAVGLDRARFAQCLGSGQFDTAIRNDMREASANGINGTPAFLIGTIDAQGKLTIVKSLSGAQTFPALQAALDEVLARKP